MAKRKQYNLDAPDTKKLVDEIVHGAFISEGSMVAFPLCFPGVTAPITADESHITTLAITKDGIVYGGTSGRRVHLFVGMFHGATGCVFDLGVVDGADHCCAFCCGRERWIACVNGPGGGRIIRGQYQSLPFNLLQEWGFIRDPLEDLGEAFRKEAICHAVVEPTGERVIVATENHLVSVLAGEGKIEVIGGIKGMGRLAVSLRGLIYGLDEKSTLWRYDPRNSVLERRIISLPEGVWSGAGLRWANDLVYECLYLVDANGRLFSFSEKAGFSGPLAQSPLIPVTTMAVTLDGRLFGACGDGISRHFCYHPGTGELKDIGVAVSVFERRRYGYQFGAAVTGRDGQIYLGENDDLGHLWIYFPRITGPDIS